MDLSLSGGDAHHPVAASSPVFTANSHNHLVLVDNTQEVIGKLLRYRQRLSEKCSSTQEGRIDIVLDNAGIEFVADLALAEWLMKLRVTDKVVFHGKVCGC